MSVRRDPLRAAGRVYTGGVVRVDRKQASTGPPVSSAPRLEPRDEFASVPDDVLDEILYRLELSDDASALLNLCNSNRRVRQFCDDDRLWVAHAMRYNNPPGLCPPYRLMMAHFLLAPARPGGNAYRIRMDTRFADVAGSYVLTDENKRSGLASLLKYGANIYSHKRRDIFGEYELVPVPAVMLAASLGHTKSMKMLADRGAILDTTYVNQYGNQSRLQLFRHAAWSGNVETIDAAAALVPGFAYSDTNLEFTDALFDCVGNPTTGREALLVFVEKLKASQWVMSEPNGKRRLKTLLLELADVHTDRDSTKNDVFIADEIYKLYIYFDLQYIDEGPEHDYLNLMLYAAVENEAVVLIDYYHDRGGDLNFRLPSRDDEPLLHAAVAHDRLESAKKLVQLGVRVDTVDKYGQNALQEAQHRFWNYNNTNGEMVEYLRASMERQQNEERMTDEEQRMESLVRQGIV